MKKRLLHRLNDRLNFSVLNIYVDIECQVYCDFSLKGTASKDKVFRLILSCDSYHILDFRIDGKIQFAHEYKTRKKAIVDTMKVQLARVLYKIDGDFIPYSIGSPKYLFIDTETTGLPKKDEKVDDHSNLDFRYWPHIVQVAFVIYDCDWNKISENSYMVSPDNYIIPQSSTRIHGISHEEAKEKGVRREDVFSYLNNLLSKVDYIIGHNVRFDINVLKCEIMRIKRRGGLKGEVSFQNKDYIFIDTMEIGTNVCRIPSLRFNGYKYPSLGELYKTLFSKDIKNQHNALADVRATVDCFNKMCDLSFVNVDKGCGSGKVFVGAEMLDTDGMSDFRVKYKKYETKDGKYEDRLVLSYIKEGRRLCRRISNDSELTEGDIIDEETVEVITFRDSGKKTYRVDADILDEEQSGWELVSAKKLAGIEDVERIFIVNKNYVRSNGHEVYRKSMCFEMENGIKRFIPLCKDSILDVADTVDIESVLLYKYAKDGHTRYGVDGDFEEANLGHAKRTYIDISSISSFDNINTNRIQDAYVCSETNYYSHGIEYEQLVLQIEFENDKVMKYDLDEDSNLDALDDVDPQSIIIFVYKEDGKEIETADASKIGKHHSRKSFLQDIGLKKTKRKRLR